MEYLRNILGQNLIIQVMVVGSISTGENNISWLEEEARVECFKILPFSIFCWILEHIQLHVGYSEKLKKRL